MSENKHTPEPWCISDHNKSIIKCYQGEQTPHGTTPYFAGGGALESERTANARRIVACVNALEGLNDYALAGGWSFRGIEAYAKGLEKQRDELLSLVESFGHKPGCRKNAFGDQCTCGVDSAIASVKGEQ